MTTSSFRVGMKLVVVDPTSRRWGECQTRVRIEVQDHATQIPKALSLCIGHKWGQHILRWRSAGTNAGQ